MIPGSRTDEELIAERRPGHAGPAFAEFYARHERAVLAYFARRVDRGEVAADLAAEAFAEALASRARFGGGNAVAWLYGIAAHVLSHSVRRGRVEDRARRRMQIPRLELIDEQVEAIERLGGDDALLSTLSALPADQSAAVRARILEEDSYAEIAARMACSESVVRKRVSRGLAALRQSLEVLESLSLELAAAAERQARRAIRRRRHVRWSAAVVVVLLGSGGAAAATGTFFWQPQLGNESQGHPSASRSGVPADQLEVLAVLRRPQTDTDRGAAARYAARWFGTQFRGVRTNSIRLLSNGAVLFTAEDGPGGANPVCLFLADKEAGGTTCVGSEQLRRQGAAIITTTEPNIKFRIKNGETVFRNGRPVPVRGSKPKPQPAHVIGVVPDGVTGVRFGTSTFPVRDNAFRADLAPDSALDRTLLDGNGDPWRGR